MFTMDVKQQCNNNNNNKAMEGKDMVKLLFGDIENWRGRWLVLKGDHLCKFHCICIPVIKLHVYLHELY